MGLAKCVGALGGGVQCGVWCEVGQHEKIERSRAGKFFYVLYEFFNFSKNLLFY